MEISNLFAAVPGTLPQELIEVLLDFGFALFE